MKFDSSIIGCEYGMFFSVVFTTLQVLYELLNAHLLLDADGLCSIQNKFLHLKIITTFSISLGNLLYFSLSHGFLDRFRKSQSLIGLLFQLIFLAGILLQLHRDIICLPRHFGKFTLLVRIFNTLNLQLNLVDTDW